MIKSHIAPQFDHLTLRNAMVPMMMLSMSHDTDDSANGVTGPKCCVVCHFDHHNLRNALVPLMML